MYELKKNGKVFTNEFFGTGPSSYKKRIYRAAVSQRLRNTGVVCYEFTEVLEERWQKMEAVGLSQSLVIFYQTTQGHTP